MMKNCRHGLPLLLFFLIALPDAVQGQAPFDAKPGFSGRVQGGALFLRTDSQLSTDSDNRTISDLDGPADAHDQLSGWASVYLTYRFENGTVVYAGNPVELGEGLAVAAGVSRPTGLGRLDAAATWLPIKEVWKNPYQTGSAREESDVDAYGVRLKLQQIAGTPWQVVYSLDRIDVEDDEIGRLFSELERSGLMHKVQVDYTLTLRPGFTLTPEVSGIYADIEGGGNSYNGIKAGVRVQRTRFPWMLLGSVSVSHHKYRDIHPLFDETHRETGFNLFVQLMRLNLFGHKRLFANIGGGSTWSDANIDFFDSLTLVGLAGLGVTF